MLPDDENARFLRRPTWRTIVESFAAKGLLALPAGVDLESFVGP